MTPEEFKHIRKSVLHCSQRQLANAFGCSRIRIMKMEQGKSSIKPETAYAMQHLAWMYVSQQEIAGILK